MYKLWFGQSQYMSILTFIWPLLPWPSSYLKKCFKLHFSSSRTTTVQNYFWNLLQVNNCAKLFWNPCIIVQVMLRTSSIHVFDHFDLYLTPVTLNFNLLKCFKWYFSSSRATTVPNCIEIHALLYKLWSGQIRTDARTHWLTHVHPTKIVTTMSRIPASGLDKNIWLHVICIQVLAHCVTPSPYFLTGFS